MKYNVIWFWILLAYITIPFIIASGVWDKFIEIEPTEEQEIFLIGYSCGAILILYFSIS